MVIKPYSNEELWNPQPYQLPPRSNLHHISPVAVRSSLVESLTSYITRLVQSHSITVSTFMTRQLAPILDKSYFEKSTFLRTFGKFI